MIVSFASAAASAARLGGRATLIARVGDDERGARFVAELEGEGVDCRFVRRTGGARTPLCAVIVDASGERIVYPAGSRPSIPLPDGRSMPVRLVLNIRKSMHYGDFIWNDANVQPGPTWVLVDLRRQLLTAFRSGHERRARGCTGDAVFRDQDPSGSRGFLL